MSEQIAYMDGQTAEITASPLAEIPALTDGDFLCPEKPTVDSELRKAFRRLPYVERGFRAFEGDVEDRCLGLETPVDEETGLPLPILVVDPPNNRANTWFVDYHHHFHARARYVEDGNDALMAVRMSRGQDLPRWLHEHYHGYFAGPKPPASREAAFRTCVLACAGVVPRQALDFGGNRGPFIRFASDRELRNLPKTIHREGTQRKDMGKTQRDHIGKFFAAYAIEQSIQEIVSQRVIDQFLFTPDKHTRAQLGNLILRKAIEVSVEPVRPLYLSLRRRGLMRQVVAEPQQIVDAYFTQSKRHDYHRTLIDRLEAAL